jgi:hypothetical protein
VFTSPWFDPARDWREIAVRAHQVLSQSVPEDLIDELPVPASAVEQLRRVA